MQLLEIFFSLQVTCKPVFISTDVFSIQGIHEATPVKKFQRKVCFPEWLF